MFSVLVCGCKNNNIKLQTKYQSKLFFSDASPNPIPFQDGNQLQFPWFNKQSNDFNLIEAILEMITKPLVGFTDGMTNILKAIREKLQPSKQGQDVTQQAQQLLKELQKLNPEKLMEQFKQGVGDAQKVLTDNVKAAGDSAQAVVQNVKDTAADIQQTVVDSVSS